MKPEYSPVKVFIAYSRKDKILLEHLQSQLRVLEQSRLIRVWYDGEIEIGVEWDQAIKQELQAADVIIMLLSSDFLASDYVYKKELQIALDQHHKGTARLFPVLLRDCAWEYSPFAALQVLPENAIPATDPHWGTVDKPFKQVVSEVGKYSKKLLTERKKVAEVERRKAVEAEKAKKREAKRATVKQNPYGKWHWPPNRYIVLLGIIAIGLGWGLFSLGFWNDSTEPEITAKKVTLADSLGTKDDTSYFDEYQSKGGLDKEKTLSNNPTTTKPKEKDTARTGNVEERVRDSSNVINLMTSSRQYMVMCGTFSIKVNAQYMEKKLRGLGYNNVELLSFDQGRYTIVKVDKFDSLSEAKTLLQELKSKGFDGYVKYVGDQ